MVGSIMQIPGTMFHMLPNPTVFYWDSNESALTTVLEDLSQIINGSVS